MRDGAPPKPTRFRLLASRSMDPSFPQQTDTAAFTAPAAAGSAPTADPALSFGKVAEIYDRGRPSYPPEAARWLTGEGRARVLELGAGTGKLTEPLAALGHNVIATEPSAAMAKRIPARAPRARVALARAEELPIADASVDVVVSAQAFHWFDHESALPEIARVLRPGGTLALVWNMRDERIPWVRRLSRIIDGRQDRVPLALDALDACEYFGTIETETFRIWQPLRRPDLHDLVLSRSSVSVLPAEAQEQKLAEADALYEEYGRGPDGMLLPYLCECYRAAVVAAPPPRPLPAPADESAERDVGEDTVAMSAPPFSRPRVQDTDDGHILIDFR